MTAEELDARTAAITTEEEALRDRLRALEDDLQGPLRRDPHARATAIDAAEREVRSIVLRLVALERERIELRVAAAL